MAMVMMMEVDDDDGDVGFVPNRQHGFVVAIT